MLAALLAGVAVALALVQAGEDSGTADVIKRDVQSQVDRLKQLVEDNTR